MFTKKGNNIFTNNSIKVGNIFTNNEKLLVQNSKTIRKSDSIIIKTENLMHKPYISLKLSKHKISNIKAQQQINLSKHIQAS